MRLQRGVTTIAPAEVQEIAREAEAESVPLYAITTRGATSRDSFFDAIRTSGLPLDPPIVSSYSWDALEDSIWGGVDRLDSRTIVIVWSDSSDFKDGCPSEFAVAMGILHDVVETLADWEATDGEPKDVCVYVVR